MLPPSLWVPSRSYCWSGNRERRLYRGARCPKSEEANFNIEAHIEDDFGINSVSILASVAKGSGEAVKFRDETFMFDSFENLGSKSVYKKYNVRRFIFFNNSR